MGTTANWHTEAKARRMSSLATLVAVTLRCT